MVYKTKLQTVRNVFNSLNNNSPDPAYLLLGGDAFLQSFFIEKVSEKISSNNVFNKSVYSLDEDDAEKILLEITGISLFSEPRIIIIRQIKKFRKNHITDIINWIDSSPVSQCIFLILDEFDLKVMIVKELTKYISVVDVRTPFPNKVKEWINFIGKTKGMTLSSEIVDMLLEGCGDSIGKINNELEKLAIFQKSNNRCELDSIISSGREFPVWKLIDAIAKKDFITSYKIYLSLYLNNVPLTRIIFNLSNLFQELLWKKMGDASNSSIGLNKIIQRNLNIYIKKFSNKEIHDIISRIRALDRKVKTSTLNDKELMIPFLLKSCKGIHGRI